MLFLLLLQLQQCEVMVNVAWQIVNTLLTLAIGSYAVSDTSVTGT